MMGPSHRKKKLIDSRGFAYKVKEHGKETTYWQCTVSPKGNYCRATVKERSGQFVTGKQFHNHSPPATGAVTATKILAAVKEQALQVVFKPASAIIEEVSTPNK